MIVIAVQQCGVEVLAGAERYALNPRESLRFPTRSFRKPLPLRVANSFG